MIKRRRKSGFRPGFEDMERRALLAGGVGINLDANAGWGPDPAWSDIRQVMDGWSRVEWLPNFGDDASIPTNATGYPLAPAVSRAVLNNYPDGVYQVSYKGTAAVDFSGIGVLSGPLTTGADGVTRGTLIVGGAGNAWPNRDLFMTVESTNPSNPMSDLHIWAPGYPADGSSPYTDAFLDSLRPFDYIRFLNWSDANYSSVSSWSQRVLPDTFGKVYPHSVFSYEEMIDLANRTGDDLWLTIPVLADDNYVNNLAALVKSRLDPGLKVYVEFGNENWNGAFPQYNQVLAMANSDPRVVPTGDLYKVAQETGFQLKRLSDAFYNAFGSGSSRVLPVLAGWTIFPEFLQYGLDAVQRVYGAPSQYIKSTAIAPYVNPDWGIGSSSSDPATLLASVSQQIDATAPDIARNAQVAASYGLPLDAYEGGVQFTSVPTLAVQTSVIEDPGLYDMTKKYLSVWWASGGRNMSFYTLTSDFWGLKPTVISPGAQRWDAVMSTVLKPGDADLDGDVDFADFQIVSANMNRVEQWWGQGDFNHDRKVDSADLAALFANLDVSSLTAAQAAQIAVARRPATVAATSPVEFQVFDQNYLADLSFTSAIVAGGSYVKDGVFNGGYGTGQLRLGGVAYPKGLGVSSSSTVALSLQGLYTSFSAVIGIDDRVASGVGQATFQVIGDGRVLYTSPVMRAGVALPIDVNVAGVSNLSLVVSSPNGSTVTIPADWAQARLVDARSSGKAAPTLTWTVTKNGATTATSSGQSFVFAPTGSGDYVVTVTARDADGRSATSSAAIKVATPAAQATASFVESYNASSGDWRGVYGSDGSVVVGDLGVYPSSASVAVSGAGAAVLDRYSSDLRALTKTQSNSRIASYWYGDSFTIDVSFSDSASHKVTLYAVDWDSNARGERIDVVDAVTGQVLDSRQLSQFNRGVYVSWNVSGHVLFRVTKTGGASAVVNGLFIDPAVANDAFKGIDASTSGNWIGKYGGQGQWTAGSEAALPTYAEMSVSSVYTAYWANPTTDPRAPQTADGSPRIAAGWYNSNISIDLNFIDGRAHQVSLYVLGWDSIQRAQSIEVVDATTGAVLDARHIGSYNGGVYLTWQVSGHVLFKLTGAGGDVAVLSGIFIDAAPGQETPPAAAASVAFSSRDTAAQGSWIGQYGSQGQAIAASPSSFPSFATVDLPNVDYTWADSTSDVRALQVAGGASRRATNWYTPDTMSFDVNLTDGQSHRVSLYMVDWDDRGRAQRIDVIDVVSGRLLDSRDVSSFTGGLYLSWNVTGRVVFRVTRTAGVNASISGVFVDAASGSGPTTPPPTTPTGFQVRDDVTQGSWAGRYGANGLATMDSSSLAPFARVSASGAQTWTWADPTADVRALQVAGGASRRASTWFTDGTMSFDVNLTDGQSHRVSLYMVDWDYRGRAQRIDVINPATGAVIDSREVSSFADGVYLSWNVTGRVVFRVTRTAGVNAVISGVFVDAASGSAPTSPTGLQSRDATTQGSWAGRYGANGLATMDSSSLAPFARVSASGAQTWTWADPTADVRALQVAGGASRRASTWFTDGTMSFDVNLTDGQSHRVSLYMVDWEGRGRAQRIDVVDPATGAVIDSREVSSFTGGLYLTWNVTGHVVFKVTCTGGVNAVIGGIFVD